MDTDITVAFATDEGMHELTLDRAEAWGLVLNVLEQLRTTEPNRLVAWDQYDEDFVYVDTNQRVPEGIDIYAR